MKIWELLSDSTKFTTQYYARRADDSWCQAIDPEATCWCLIGAGKKCYPNNADFYRAMRRLEIEVKPENNSAELNTCLGEWNDKATWEEARDLAKKVDV